jgi:hypothetical protein
LLIHEGVAVKFMKRERLLSLGTFTSIFSRYVITDYVQEAILTFKVMEQYDIPLDLALLKGWEGQHDAIEGERERERDLNDLRRKRRKRKIIMIFFFFFGYGKDVNFLKQQAEK